MWEFTEETGVGLTCKRKKMETYGNMIDSILISLQNDNAREGMEKRETSNIVGGDVNWYNYYGK